MVMAMLAMLLVQTGSGLFADDEIMTQGPLSVKASSAVVARMNWIHEFNKWLIVGRSRCTWPRSRPTSGASR
jgi:cytochrome b